MKVTIIIPTYNELENIEKLIKTVFPITNKIKNHDIHLLIVDDNSPDGTLNVVKKLEAKYPKLHHITGQKEGLGKAYLRGMKYASEKLKAEVMFEMDADFSHDPKRIPEFLKKIDAGNDLVVGSRYIDGGSIPDNWGFHRKIFSVLGNLIVRGMLLNFKHHDWTTGYRAIRTPLYLKIRHELEDFKGYTFQVSFLHKALLSGAKVVETPINFVDRRYGKSKIGSEYIINLLGYLITTNIKNPPRVFRFLVVGTLGFIINSIGLAVFQRFGLKASVASAIGAEIAIVSNFIWNNLWTFSDQKITSVKQLPKKFALFNLSSFGSVVIQFVTIEGCTRILGNTQIIVWSSYILGVFFGLIWNYTMYNLLIWKKPATVAT
jgi:dolichol-phosphate mannosyltransferase